MNIAASSLIIFGLLLPGIAFRRFYYTGEFSKQYFSENVGQLISRVFVPAMLFQLAFAVVVSLVQATDVQTAYRAVIAQALQLGVDGVRVHARAAFILVAGQAILFMAAAAAGYVAQAIVRRRGLDRRYKLLRFQNYWHYVLRGGIRQFGGVKTLLPSGADDVVIITYVDVLATTSEGDALYEGILADYELLPDNRLDKLILIEARRRYLKADRKSGGDPQDRYAIPGDFFVLPADGIRNVNVRYVTSVELEDAIVSLTDADGDTSSAAYFNQP